MRSAFGKVVKAGYNTMPKTSAMRKPGVEPGLWNFFKEETGVMETPPNRRDFRKSGGLFTSITPLLEAVASRKLSKAQGLKP